MELLTVATVLAVLAGAAIQGTVASPIDNAASIHGESRVSVTCVECHAMVGGLQAVVNAGASLEEIEALAVGVCVAAHLFTEDVCRTMVKLSAEEVIYVLMNTPYDIDTICYFFFKICHSSLPLWELELPPNKPGTSHPEGVQEGPTTYRILHLSDTHFDPLYLEGSPTVCDHPLCCRAWGDHAQPDTPMAGLWGAESGECDAPQRTLEAALAAAVELQPDIIYMTGDVPPHDIWLQSHESIIASIETTAGIIRNYFPTTPIAYCLGNHEAAPVNSYAVPAVYPDGFDMDWLYSVLVTVWGDAGVPAEVMGTVEAGGYYHWSPTHGLRVVSLNTNYGFWQNWFLLIDDVDPTGQLAWLSEVLLEAEAAGEKVHLLGHVPPGGTLTSWSRALNRLITRFEGTITGIFVGHTHWDSFEIHFDTEDNTRAVAVSYISASLNSNGVKSPSFRTYKVDGGYKNATWTVLDHSTHSLNLTLANAGADPLFPESYTAKSAYGLTSLSPASWADAVWQMATDTNLFNEYRRHYYSFWSEPPQLDECDTNCRKNDLCGLYSANSADDEPCQRIMAEVDSNMTGTL